jgi:hypothetical protein
MTILRAAALAALFASTGVAHAGERHRFHDEAGLLVAFGIVADTLGASLLADLIAPATPDVVCDHDCVPRSDIPYGYAPPVDIGTRRSSDAAWAGRW